MIVVYSVLWEVVEDSVIILRNIVRKMSLLQLKSLSISSHQVPLSMNKIRTYVF